MRPLNWLLVVLLEAVDVALGADVTMPRSVLWGGGGPESSMDANK